MKTHIITILCCLCCWLGTSQSITDIEYFYNTDPGFGNATAVTPNANTGTLTQDLNIGVPLDATGFNTLYVRTRDANNVWSLYANVIFYITDNSTATTATNIAAAEYFINTDPGAGNANTIAIDPNSGIVTQNFAIPIGLDLDGFNTLYVRTQDDIGLWSLYDVVKFFVTDIQSGGASNIAAIEYFIDTDPGFGNASALSVNTNTGTTTQQVNIPLGTLDEGFHNLYIRTQDDLGEWSLYDKRIFFVTPPQEVSPITAAEYFYDTDPGFGNGTPVALVPTGNVDEFTVDLSTADITCDFHDFYIRLINEDGTWSLYDYGLQIEVFDNANPTIVVFDDITVTLDASGQGSLTIADVDNGTFDDCELVSVELNQAQFDYTCANLGANTVTITAIDAEAKESTQEVTVTVVDNINPVAVAQNITIALDETGTASISANDLENGSTDNCGIANRSLNISNFTCDNLGENTVSFTVEDTSGNSNSVDVVVTVIDDLIPTATAQNISIQLDASGLATIVADDIDTSTDNCAIATKTIDVSSFDCSNLGANTVTLMVTDTSGNTNNTTAVVTVEDNINPVAVAQNITVELDENGLATITANDLENGSSDNCSISNRSIDITTFTCDDLGANTVSFTVEDSSGNTNSVDVIVTVEDTINPTLTTQDITVALGADGTLTIDAFAPVVDSNDNCQLDVILDNDFFTCDNLGTNTVSVLAIDGSGNNVENVVTVTVVDDISPTVITQNLTLQLDASGIAVITVDDIDNGSSDNCSIASRSLDLTDFNCSNLGENTVTLSVTDTSGNTTNETATITVVDTANPIAVAQNITIQLDNNGLVTISANDLENGSSDNCGITGRSIDIASFNCTNLGDNTVTFTVEDASGNSNSTTAIVTVEDRIDPIAIGQDITVDLAGNPSVSITAEDVNNGSSDNCGSITLSIDVDTFSAPGEYPVTLSVEDADGNLVSVTVTVTVIDSSLSLDDNNIQNNNILIHPNPANDVLYYKTSSTIISFSIIDITGKTVIKQLQPQNRIEVQQLSHGVYFINFKTDGGQSIIKRFIKN